MKRIFILGLLIGMALFANAQLISNPFSRERHDVFRLPVGDSSTVINNTFKVSLSIPGYWYSNGQYQAAVVGFGYAYEHYVNDSLIYSIGPYLWYKTPIPSGSTQLPFLYGPAATYKGLIVAGIATPDFVHWGPVLTLNFSFGNGGISL